MAKEYPSLKELTYHAILDTDTDISGAGWVLDEDDFASDSATKVPTQQSTKAYVQTYVSAHSGRNGATEVTSATDITLTSTSDFFQIIEMTTAGNSVTLPDATEFTDEGWAFIIRPTGYDFFIKDNGGNLVCTTQGEDVVILLRDNSTANGNWDVIYDTASVSSVLAGDEVVYNSDVTYHIAVATLSPQTAIVCYEDVNNSYYGTACILTIDGDSITAGPEIVFNSAGTYYIAVTALSETKAIVCYRDGGNSNYGTAAILDISGTSITAGTATVYNAGDSNNQSVAKLSGTKAIVCYSDAGNSTYGTACILDVSGSTITAGSETVYNAGTTYNNSVAALSETAAVVCYVDSGNSSYGTACILSISGATITAGAETVFNTGNTYYVAVCALSSVKAIVCYKDNVSPYYGKANVLSISGTTITVSAAETFSDGAPAVASVTKASDNGVIVSFADGDNSNYGTACAINVNGTSMEPGSELVFAGASSYMAASGFAGENRLIAAYRDIDNSDYGTACVLTGVI